MNMCLLWKCILWMSSVLWHTLWLYILLTFHCLIFVVHYILGMCMRWIYHPQFHFISYTTFKAWINSSSFQYHFLITSLDECFTSNSCSHLLCYCVLIWPKHCFHFSHCYPAKLQYLFANNKYLFYSPFCFFHLGISILQEVFPLA